MSFFDGFKNIKKQINQLDSALTIGSNSLLDVYERNIKLEKEIQARTQELDMANKQMLTLQHVWEMMNSSKPLSSVLNAIVNSLQGEFGYVYSFIIKQIYDAKGAYLQLEATSRDDMGIKLSSCLGCDLSQYKFKAPSNDGIRKAIDNNEIYQSSEIEDFMYDIMPDLDKESVNAILSESKMASFILIPLQSKKSFFGSLVVFSSRANATKNELNFLKLFAKQIELALTIADLFQAVKEQAITDSMTGLYNRRYFEEFLKKEAIRSNRQNQKFTVIGLDLDHLKKINDKYGHNYGDSAIKAIAEVLKNNARAIDIAARMGGEEFNLILPGIDSKGGMIAAERIRKAIEAVELEKIGHITASLGVSTYFEHTDDIDELLELSDQAMYESKRKGRNRVTCAKPSSEISWQEVATNTFVDILSKHRIPIDNALAEYLNDKLNEIGNEKLYQVADALVSTYNPEHPDGGVKEKVQIATLLAKRFDLPKDEIDKLRIATMLYDIGNTMLPREILQKKSPLTDEDKDSIKQHPLIAARQILKPISNVIDIIPIIEKHHENWNGTGYPNQIAGEDIPIESQIILIIDSYFALLEKRPYRDAMSVNEALRTISEEADEKWSQKLAEEFISIVRTELL